MTSRHGGSMRPKVADGPPQSFRRVRLLCAFAVQEEAERKLAGSDRERRAAIVQIRRAVPIGKQGQRRFEGGIALRRPVGQKGRDHAAQARLARVAIVHLVGDEILGRDRLIGAVELQKPCPPVGAS
jgi:hypothetical protein